VRGVRLVDTSRVSNVPHSPHELVRFLPEGDELVSLLQRANFGLRVASIVRVGAPIEIDRSSVREARDTRRNRVVVFRFVSKNSRIAKVQSDSNNLEFLPRDSPNVLKCPARALLAACAKVEELALDFGVAVPRTPFVFVPFGKRLLRVYSERTLSLWVRKLMDKAGWEDTVSAKHLRQFSNQTMQQAGVSPADICIRAGWADKQSSTRSQHYSDFRLVRDSFVSIVFDGVSRHDAGNTVDD